MTTENIDSEYEPVVKLIKNTSCPECDGEGYYEYIKNYGSMSYYTTRSGDPWGPEYVQSKCEECDGTGKQHCMGCGDELGDTAYDVDDELWCSTECYNHPMYKHEIVLKSITE